jgi:hypothetical protein
LTGQEVSAFIPSHVLWSVGLIGSGPSNAGGRFDPGREDLRMAEGGDRTREQPANVPAIRLQVTNWKERGCDVSHRE